MRQAGKLLLIVVFLCLPLACEPAQSNPGDSGLPVCLNIHLPGGWQPLETRYLDTNGDNEQEAVILYRFDLPSETGQQGSPIRAVVYQIDEEELPNILAHELLTPDNDYLCECACALTMEDVLSGLDGPELVVRDQCNGERSRLTIFHWDSVQIKYVSGGHFHGHEIEVAPNEVRVEERLLDRAQLARRTIHHSSDGITYDWSRDELIFCHEEPQDVTSSPYPEKVVLSLYNHYTDTAKIQTYFTVAGWERLGQCDTGRCGCSSMRFEVAHVWVTDLRSEPENTISGSDRAIVTATVNCERQGGLPDGERPIRWSLIREAGRWKLDNAE
jgi:hypothetical protein